MACKICDIINKKIPAKIIYEDNAVMAVLTDEPTIFGHVWVFPKQHLKTIEEIDDKIVTQLFYVASYTASALFEGLGAEGTNIIICNGDHCSQKYPHLIIDVMPRKANDGIDFRWTPKRLEEEEMKSSQDKIKDKADLIVHNEKKQKQMQMPKEAKEKEEKKEEIPYEEENYLVRHLTRLP